MNQEKRRNEILTKLMTIRGMTTDKVWESWLTQAIDFIKEQN